MALHSDLNFRYMRWAKTHGPARLHIGLSGVAPPDDLGSITVDLVQHGPDMPPVVRDRVAAHLGLEPAQVMLTLGTSHALYLAAASSLTAGDLCLVESPDYEVMHLLPQVHGARVESFLRRMECGYRIDDGVVARVHAERPRLVMLTNPHNPTGAMLSLEELRPLADAVGAVGGRLVVDEVYLEYEPDRAARSAVHLGAHVMALASFTKAFGFGAVRFGWMAASPEQIEKAIAYNDFISVLYPTPLAQVGAAGLDRLGELRQRTACIRQRGLDIVTSWVEGRDDVQWHRPESGVMALLRLVHVADTMEFAERLERDRGVVVVPGDFFSAPGTVRIGYGGDEAVLREGLAELGQALDVARGRR